MIGVQWWSEDVEYPALQEPAWSSMVERWYQMDTPSFVLTETYWRLREKIPVPPEWLVLASPGASNLTDFQFATTAAPSPAKFVHTLPNIRSAALLQVMKWSGKVLCVQKDPATLISAISESVILADEGPVWIASVTANEGRYTGHILTLSSNHPSPVLKINKNGSGTMSSAASHDKDLLLWNSQISRTSAGSAEAFRAADFSLSRWVQ